MTAIAAYFPIRTSVERRERASVHAVEKIRPRTGFDGEYQSRREPQSWICAAAARRPVCQRGTADDGSFWDAPPLKPEFAAQVIGQTLDPGTPAVSVHTAYRSAAPVCPLLFDKNV
jgi:hypothetical protein